MSDLFGNHIVGFPTRQLNYQKQVTSAKCTLFCHKLTIAFLDSTKKDELPYNIFIICPQGFQLA